MIDNQLKIYIYYIEIESQRRGEFVREREREWEEREREKTDLCEADCVVRSHGQVVDPLLHLHNPNNSKQKTRKDIFEFLPQNIDLCTCINYILAKNYTHFIVSFLDA